METLNTKLYSVQVANIVPVVTLKVLGAEQNLHPQQSWIFCYPSYRHSK